MLKPTVLILLCALPVGWLAELVWSRAGDAASGNAPGRAAGISSPDTRRQRDVSRVQKLDPQEIMALVYQRSAAERELGYSQTGDLLADWKDGEIVTALQESIADPALHGLPGEQGNATILLLQEWLKRDEAAAVKWFEGLDSAVLKGQLADTMLEIWLPDRAEQGLDFLVANRDVYRFGIESEFIRLAAREIGERGPDAMNGLLRKLREKRVDTSDIHLGIPRTFDFQALAAGEELRKAVAADPGHSVLLSWAAADRDGAYQWALENFGADGVWRMVLSRESRGVPDDKEWAVARYEGMKADERRAFQESAGNFLGPEMEHLRWLSKSVRDPALREELTLQGVQGLFTGRTQLAVVMLEQAGPPERQLEILETIVPQPRGVPPVPLDEESVRELVSRLTDDEARIEAIIRRLGNP